MSSRKKSRTATETANGKLTGGRNCRLGRICVDADIAEAIRERAACLEISPGAYVAVAVRRQFKIDDKRGARFVEETETPLPELTAEERTGMAG